MFVSEGSMDSESTWSHEMVWCSAGDKSFPETSNFFMDAYSWVNNHDYYFQLTSANEAIAAKHQASVWFGNIIINICIYAPQKIQSMM